LSFAGCTAAGLAGLPWLAILRQPISAAAAAQGVSTVNTVGPGDQPPPNAADAVSPAAAPISTVNPIDSPPADTGKNHEGNCTMNTQLKTRIAHRAAAILASTLVTFTGLQLITNYALPPQSAEQTVVLAANTSATTSAHIGAVTSVNTNPAR
jgi:hypothetical protein